jgi:hypothetical protein
MPQMRAVMSGASVARRPCRSASKKRGGSKILSATSPTTPSRTSTWSEPSPSTRESPLSTPCAARPIRGSSPFRTIFGRDGLCAPGQRPGTADRTPGCLRRRWRTGVRRRRGHAAVEQLRRARASVFAPSDGPKQPKQPRPMDGHRAPHPARVTGPRHAVARRRRAGTPCPSPCTPGRPCAWG